MRVHFIAIGGSIMHQLAIALLKKGFQVSGSDDVIYEPSKTHLSKYNLLPTELGWFPEKLDISINAVVIGMHAHENNPELLKAQELGLHIYSYPEFIYEQSADKIRVVIGGSHGKTTIISIIMHVLQFLGRDFDYLVGAKLEEFDSLIRITKEARLMIIEGDEYLASPLDKRPKFLVYKANIALISGIAWDHLDAFPTFDAYLAQFKSFIQSVEPRGTLIYNKEDEQLQKLVNLDNSPINKHGYRTPEYVINKGVTSLKTPNGEVPLLIFGKHNLSNIAAAYTVCEWIGISRKDFLSAIQTFKGAARRLEYVADRDGSVVYKDFIQFPERLQESILLFKEQHPDKLLLVILELPTNNSLNKEFLEQYRDGLKDADFPVVYINLSAFKQKNISSKPEEILKIIFNDRGIMCFTDINEITQFLKELNHQGKNLLYISSGNIEGINLSNLLENFF
ncbi:UDP-N-acetylmuramate: L-alanyl-gamma-D-glutamyl-meso-diaminopimelate ligase [bacterium A37T11]|nr:UDP-N-acetylmuramate: L-alanyl-gamma-D-glutamyl-meso-diaminopimelate ligase [bacterium A37T11]